MVSWHVPPKVLHFSTERNAKRRTDLTKAMTVNANDYTLTVVRTPLLMQQGITFLSSLSVLDHEVLAAAALSRGPNFRQQLLTQHVHISAAGMLWCANILDFITCPAGLSTHHGQLFWRVGIKLTITGWEFMDRIIPTESKAHTNTNPDPVASDRHKGDTEIHNNTCFSSSEETPRHCNMFRIQIAPRPIITQTPRWISAPRFPLFQERDKPVYLE